MLDVRDIAKPGFDAQEFVMYCARRGAVELEGRRYTLLVAPMAGFYRGAATQPGAHADAHRLRGAAGGACGEVPILFRELLARYEAQRA